MELWVRRYYVLIRREQIDEMVNGTSDVLHELCVFDSASEHAECLSSLELEEVVTFDYGPDAGQPAHIKEANAIKRLGQQVAAKSAAALAAGFGSTKRTLFTGIAEMFPVKFSTDEIADFTFQLSFPDRVLRLRAETKSSFDNWRALFQNIIPPTVCEVSHSGWLWRKRFGGWEQRFAIIYEGVLYFFVNFEDYEKFKLVASRGNDAIFVAAPLAEDCIGLEMVEVTEHHVWEDRNFVLHFTVEDPPLSELMSAVDDAQSNAWALAVRNARHWFETIPDEHPTRKLFGGLGGEEDGPMLASNRNPLVALNKENEADLAVQKAREEAREKARQERLERRRAKRAEAKARNKRKAKKNGSGSSQAGSSERDSSNGSGSSRSSSRSGSSPARSTSLSLGGSLDRTGSSGSKKKSGKGKGKNKSKNNLVRRAVGADVGGGSVSPARTGSNSSVNSFSAARRSSVSNDLQAAPRASSSTFSDSSNSNSPALPRPTSSSNAAQRAPSIGGANKPVGAMGSPTNASVNANMRAPSNQGVPRTASNSGAARAVPSNNPLYRG